jgi:hypothetical protein
METGNVDLVLSEITADECNEAAEELARYLDAGLLATRKLLAAFLNDLNNECLTRWGRGGKTADRAMCPNQTSWSNGEQPTTYSLAPTGSAYLRQLDACRWSSSGGAQYERPV